MRNNSVPDDKTKNLVVAQSNIEKGITSLHKTGQIEHSLNVNGVDVFIINETGLNKGMDSSSLHLPTNYAFLRKDRDDREQAGGGVGILINKNLDWEEYNMHTPIEFKKVEAIWVHLKKPIYIYLLIL